MPTLTVIVGPSGSGKTTLADLLVARRGFSKVVSTTSRGPRPGEIDGVHYNFLSRDQFLERVNEDKFVEHARFAGNLYGITKKAIEDATSSGSGNAVSINEIVGWRALRELYMFKPSHIKMSTIFLDADLSTLVGRLSSRNMTPEDLEKRVALLREERLAITRAFAFDDVNFAINKNRRFLLSPTLKQVDAFVESYVPRE